MLDESELTILDDELSVVAPREQEWRPILEASNQVVLYNPTSHALSVTTVTTRETEEGHVVKRNHPGRCPLCHRTMISSPNHSDEEEEKELDGILGDYSDHPRSRAPNYFQLLQIANETASVPPTPVSRSPSPSRTSVRSVSHDGSIHGGEEPMFRAESMAEGYFKAFFQEECRLGMGANGSVYLCQHVLDGNPLGHFAVKKIAVGQSHSYLFNILREVRLLEKLHHPNIITYHHAWLETCQFSSFGPKVPTLHVLMQWAEGGSLDDFIDQRLGRASAPPYHAQNSSHPSSGTQDLTEDPAALSRGARIRAFRAMQHASPEERERLRRQMAGEHNKQNGSWKAVHLLSAEEVKSLFQDVVEGLVFLHDKSILHLDLKPGNVLLTWDEGKLIPRAMLSDFGTSQDMLNSRARSGNTGTLEYASPESLPSPTGVLRQVDSKSDMWSLGMILHKLLFFRLPYRYASDSPEKNSDSRRDAKKTMDLLEKEVQSYPGFKSTQGLVTAFESRRLPRAFLVLLESLLHVKPSSRPSSERVLAAIREGKLNSLVSVPATAPPAASSLVPAVRRPSPEMPRSSSPRPSSEGASSRMPGVHPILQDMKDDSIQTEKVSEDIPLLGLPAPLDSTMPPKHGSPSWASVKVWGEEIVLIPPITRSFVVRTLKSGLLVMKAWSLSRIHLDTSISSWILNVALALALVDTWSESLSTSLVLGVGHIALVRLAYKLSD